MERDSAVKQYLERKANGEEVYLIAVPREDGKRGYLVKGPKWLETNKINKDRFWYVPDAKTIVTISEIQDYPNVKL